MPDDIREVVIRASQLGAVSPTMTEVITGVDERTIIVSESQRGYNQGSEPGRLTLLQDCPH